MVPVVLPRGVSGRTVAWVIVCIVLPILAVIAICSCRAYCFKMEDEEDRRRNSTHGVERSRGRRTTPNEEWEAGRDILDV